MATTELAKLVEMGARQGISGRDSLLVFTRQTAMMADAFGMPVEEIGEQMGKIANNYKIPIPAIGQLADAINWLDDSSNAKGSEIINVLARVGGVASTVKITSEQTAALASTLLSLGETSETAGTAINAIFQKFAAAEKGTAKFRKAFAEIGLSTKAVQAGMQTDAIGTLQKVIAAVNKLPEQARSGVMVELVGLEHSDTLAKLVSSREILEQQLRIANDQGANGSMQRESDSRKGTLSARYQITKNQLFNATSSLGETLRPQLIELMDTIGRYLGQIRAWVAANPELAGTLVKVTAAIAVVLVAMGSLGLALAAVLGPLALTRYGLGMLGGKLGSTLGVLGKFGGALKWFGGALLKLGSIARVAFTFLFGMLGTVLRFVGAAIKFLGAMLLRLLSIARVVFAFLMANPWIAIATVIAGIAVAIWSNWDKLGPMFAALWANIKAGAGAAWDWLAAKVVGAAQAIVEPFSHLPGLLSRQWDSIKATMTSLPGHFLSIGGQMIDGLINGISARWGALKDKFASLGDALPGWLRTKLDIHSPSRVFAQIGQHTMQGLEAGIDKHQQGPLASMLALSRQLTTPLAASVALGASVLAPAAPVRIDSRPPLARSAAPVQAAPVSINITINAAPGMDERNLAQLVAQEIAKHQRNLNAAKRSRLSDAE